MLSVLPCKGLKLVKRKNVRKIRGRILKTFLQEQCFRFICFIHCGYQL